MKLALGAAQFGFDYGAFNQRGKVTHSEVQEILRLARQAGIQLIDTASAYLESEKVLGDARASNYFEITTKCPSLRGETDPVGRIEKSLHQSLVELHTDRIYAYLLHDATDLTSENGKEIWACMESIRAQGLAMRIGISAYSIEEAQILCDEYPISLVQLPANILYPWFEDACLPQDVEVHVRSVFLQGLLLSSPDSLTGSLHKWKGVLEDFRVRCAKLGITQLEACLLPLISCNNIHRIIVGVDSTTQLNSIIDSLVDAEPVQLSDVGAFPEATADLTDPRNWNN